MYRALTTFSGRISMIKGEVRDIDDPEIVADLLRAKYIVDLEEKKKKAEDPARKSTKRSSKKKSKGGASNE